MKAEKDRLHNYFNEEESRSPSFDFTDKVMGRVEEIVETPFVVKPLISKKGWLLILAVAIVVVGGSFALELVESVQKIPSFFSFENFEIKNFETSIKITVVIVLLLLGLTAADIIYRRMKNIA